MCPEQDSNLHAFRHSHLKRARLPFRHLGNKQLNTKVVEIFIINNLKWWKMEKCQ